MERDRIQELLDGELSAGGEAALEQHLAGCLDCRAYQLSMLRAVGRLDDLFKRPTEAGVPDLVVALGLARPKPLPLLAKLPLRRSWGSAWGAIAACAMLAVGVTGSHLQTPAPAPTTLATVSHQVGSPNIELAVAGAGTQDDSEAILTWFGPEDASEGADLSE